jgi:cysteine synthase A
MPRDKCYSDATKAIGDTPMIQINRLVPSDNATVFAKCEFFQPLNSVKDRIGAAMIEAGERDGNINADTHVIEPTSGNTGIALAFVCAAKGYKLTLTMPESMSVERRALLRAMGANLVLTPAGEGMKGAINRAAELVATTENAYMPQQFENPANPAIHEATTGPEVWADSGQDIDAIVAGVGTGGTITGVTRFLKKQNPNFKAFAVEPKPENQRDDKCEPSKRCNKRLKKKPGEVRRTLSQKTRGMLTVWSQKNRHQLITAKGAR